MGQCLAKLKDAEPINGWEGFYITPNGKVFKVSEVIPHLNNSGYLVVKVMISGKTLRDYVHRLVARTFLNNPQNLKTVDHIDGDKLNNDSSNLQWFSLANNIRKYFSKDYVLVDPKGFSHHFRNINKFAKENGLDNSSVCKVLKGKFSHTKGWTAPREDHYE